MGSIIINLGLMISMLIFSTVYYLEIIALPRFEQKFTICACYYAFIFFSSIIIIRNLKQLIQLEKDGMLQDEWAKWYRNINWNFLFKKLTFFALCGGYILAIIKVGFFVSSFIFMLIVMFMLGSKRYVSIAAISAGFVLLTYLIFVYFLHINLPHGVLF
ncbi:MAG: tripartite tricarboxylate transporter TctB family protein [Pseudomonadota bacterium]